MVLEEGDEEGMRKGERGVRHRLDSGKLRRCSPGSRDAPFGPERSGPLQHPRQMKGLIRRSPHGWILMGADRPTSWPEAEAGSDGA